MPLSVDILSLSSGIEMETLSLTQPRLSPAPAGLGGTDGMAQAQCLLRIILTPVQLNRANLGDALSPNTTQLVLTSTPASFIRLEFYNPRLAVRETAQ